ncbi:MAG: family 43 glycosylhydrolase [Lachnospiraceae bacterium]|nr:family 43 glycosylhydrolase [Lachnospiraceae bacterium]
MKVCRLCKKGILWVCLIIGLMFCGCSKSSDSFGEGGQNLESSVMDSAAGNAQQSTEKEDELLTSQVEEESSMGASEQEKEQPTETEQIMNIEKLELTASFKGMANSNPLISQDFGADPYAMVYGDRVYFYMTADAFEYDKDGNITENTYGKIQSIHVISTDDMVNFTDHGCIPVAGRNGVAKWANNSWAPAAAWKNIDGKDKFFLYFADAGGGIGVITADSPTGPFTDPLGKGLIRRDMPNCGNVLWLFDPAVLVDDDGQAYIYFGGGVPEGKVSDPGTGRVAKLGEDMISIVGEAVTLDVPYLFEDSGIHKYKDKYYYTYCSNWQVDAAGTEKYGFRNAEIVSLVSDSPMGPFEFHEVILANPGTVFGLHGNNHHAVFTFQDRWYITYHARTLEKAMGVEKGYRSTHIEEFQMDEDGSIGRILMTWMGREQLKYVDAYTNNMASNLANQAGIRMVPADGTSSYFGCGNYAVGDIHKGDWMKVQGVDFKDVSAKTLSFFAKGVSSDAEVQVRIDTPNGEAIALVKLHAVEGDEFVEYKAELLQEVTGVHNLFFIFDGEGFEFGSWRFMQ